MIDLLCVDCYEVLYTNRDSGGERATGCSGASGRGTNDSMAETGHASRAAKQGDWSAVPAVGVLGFSQALQ